MKAQRAREKVARMKQEQSIDTAEGESQVISQEQEEADDSDQHDGLAQISDTEGDNVPVPSAGPIPIPIAEPAGMEESDGFVFAIHRRTVSYGEICQNTCAMWQYYNTLQYSVEHYFTRHQKTRLMLFGVPLVVPCVALSTGEELYAKVWEQVKRLIIPDPPAQHRYPIPPYMSMFMWPWTPLLSLSLSLSCTFKA